MMTLWASGQGTNLMYKLQSGEVYLIDIDIQQTTRSESMDAQELILSSRSRLIYSVDSINEMDNYHITARYSDLQISMMAPELGIDFNSLSGKDPILTAMVKDLEKGTFQLEMDPTGELLYLEGLDEMFRSLVSFPATDSQRMDVILNTLMEVYGPDAFKSQFNLLVTVYPVLSTMSQWTNDILYYFNTKPVWISNRYNLTRNDEKTVVIQGIGMLTGNKEFTEETSMGKVKSVVSGSQTYDFQMDPLTGWLRSCVSRQRILVETTILKSVYLPAGLKIPSYTETIFEVKGSKMN
jgi:hypothetical protein